MFVEKGPSRKSKENNINIQKANTVVLFETVSFKNFFAIFIECCAKKMCFMLFLFNYHRHYILRESIFMYQLCIRVI